LLAGPRLTVREIDGLFTGGQTAQSRAYSLSAAVVRDLIRRRDDRGLSLAEKEMLNETARPLVAEIAVAVKTSEEAQRLYGQHHNWEKRAKDSQRSFSIERTAREKAEQAAAEAVALAERFKREADELRRAQAQPAAPTVPTVSRDEQLEEFRTVYPDIAQGVSEMVNPLRSELEELREERKQREIREHTDRFIGEASSDPRLADVDIHSMIGSSELTAWLDARGGYAYRVMNNTFAPELGFTPKDVADVLALFVKERGQTQTGVKVQDTPPPPPARPVTHREAGDIDSSAATVDVFTLDEMNNLQNLADKVGRASQKTGNAKLLEDFDQKIDRSIRYYDALSKKRTATH
jgi:hypothetical protein